MGRVKIIPNTYDILVERVLLYKRYSNLIPETTMKDITKFIHCK